LGVLTDVFVDNSILEFHYAVSDLLIWLMMRGMSHGNEKYVSL